MIVNRSITGSVHEESADQPTGSPVGLRAEHEGLAEQLVRRHEAALRLPPLSCGCHDPETQTHLAGKCRYRRAA